MRTRDELESALNAQGWKLVDGPHKVHDGWRATIQRGTTSVPMTGRSEISTLEDLLRFAEAHTRRRP